MEKIDFRQLVESFKNGDLTLTHIQSAFRTSIREDDYFPIEIKGILCGVGKMDSGLVGKYFYLLDTTVRNFVLAVMRSKIKITNKKDNPFCRHCKEPECLISLDGECEMIRIYKRRGEKENND